MRFGQLRHGGKTSFLWISLALITFFLSDCSSSNQPTLTDVLIPSSTPEPTTILIPTARQPNTEMPQPPPMSTATMKPAPSILELVGHIGEEVAGFAAPQGAYNSPGLAWNVVVQNQYAYVTQGADGPAGTQWGRLSIVDVADPTSPVLAGSFLLGWIATDVSIVNKIAYLTDGHCEFGMAACGGDLYILDISDPKIPHQLSEYPFYSIHDGFLDRDSWYIAGVAIQDDYAYVSGGTFYPQPAGNDCGLQAIDITTPESPKLAGALLCDKGKETWSGHGLVVEGNYVYVAGGETGIHIIDATNPHALTEVGHIGNIGNVVDVAIKDKLAFLATNESGLQIVDVSDPMAPAKVAILKPKHGIVGIAVADVYAFAASANEGIYVLDVSDPLSPMEVAFHDSLRFVRGVTALNGYIYVADEEKGLLILKFVPLR